MATSLARSNERWDFLAPWCEALNDRIFYAWAERKEEIWDVPKRRLEVKMPTRRQLLYEFWDEPRRIFPSEKAFRAGLNKTREALALLAAVAHVDQEGWKYLLKVHCCVPFGRDEVEVFEEDIPARFMLYFIEGTKRGDYKKYVETLKADLVQLCGVYQREHPSRAYLKALKQISSFDTNRKAGKPGIDLDVPVQVGFRVMDFHSYGILHEILEPLQDIRAAEKIIQDEWEEYEQNPRKKDVRCGNLRCTVRLGPMIADFHSTNMSPDVVKTMETMIQENARFSQVNLPIFVDRELKRKDQRVSFSRAMASAFDTIRREPSYVLKCGDSGAVQVNSTTESLQLGTVHMGCSSLWSPREVESLCSGIVVSQTTRKLSIFSDVIPHKERDDEKSALWWRWLAYALFSKRAAEFSAIESVALVSISGMSVADMEAFKGVLESDHPEEELFGCPRGQVEARDATVKAGASFYWELTNRGIPRRDSRVFTCQSPLSPVRTFSDDGKSEWVNALVPGYGNCYVCRDDLVFHDTGVVTALAGGLKDLRIDFARYGDFDWRELIFDGLPKFLAIVGPSLKSLTLDISGNEIDTNAVIRSCPNLEELSLIGGDLVDIRFNFSDFRARNEPVPELPVEWDHISTLANHLSDPDSALAKCVRRLRIYHFVGARRIAFEAGYNRPVARGGLTALLDMLEGNRSLEYLDIMILNGRSLYEFGPHHLTPIHRSLKLPTEIKTAFLSVFSFEEKLDNKKQKMRRTRANHAVSPQVQLDQHVLSTIFAFAAPPVLRKVYLRDPPVYCDGDEPDRLPI